MTARAAYPNAAIYPHGALTATQLEQLCGDHKLRLMQTSRGHLYLSSVAPQVPDRSGPDGSPSSVGNPAAAAGHTFPEAA